MPPVEKGAIISKCQKYRYSLWRIWDRDKELVLFIGLNPSIADSEKDDPTVRRCIEYVKSWGYGGLYMANLFALRSRNPDNILKNKNPIGANNDKHIQELLEKTNFHLVAWGDKGNICNRNKEVLSMIKKPYCLALTKKGNPRHPLYAKKNSDPISFRKGSKGVIREIPNESLTVLDLPSIDSSFDELSRFALTFNGYEYWGSLKKCAQVAKRVDAAYAQGQKIPSSMADLRTALFFEQRSIRHSDCAMRITKEDGTVIEIKNDAQIADTLLYMQAIIKKMHEII